MTRPKFRIIAGQKYEQLSTGVLVKVISDNSDVNLTDKEPFYNTKGELKEDALPLIIVFSYNRPEMLLENLKHLSQFKARIVVIDDGSEFDPIAHEIYSEFQRFDHHGKNGFWKLWNIALQIARLHGSEFNLFTHDDMQDTKVDKMVRDSVLFPELYACKMINDGRESNWGDKIYLPYKKKWIEDNFTDCSFFTNYQTLEKLGFKINPIGDRGENLSSGVGRQTTMRLREMKIPMYAPVKSYAFHGEHDSVMHPEGRKENPLISK